MTRKTTTKKPSQLDRAIKRIDKLVFDLEDRLKGHITDLHNKVITETNAIDETVDRIEGKADLLLKGSDFMKEIGEKEEPWVPGLGESVTTTMPHVFGVVTGLHSAGGIDIITVKHSGGTGNWNERNVFKATPLEVQKYEEQVKAQEQEAKIEHWRKTTLNWPQLVKYGSRDAIVRSHHGKTERNNNNGMGWVSLTFKEGDTNCVSPMDLTLIDP